MVVHNRFSVSEDTWTDCILYTDTLFAKEKSIFGNTCAQIFTDGEFVQIIIIRYKSEDEKNLDRINRDIWVANDIFMDNAPNQTDYKIEMKGVKILARIEV